MATPASNLQLTYPEVADCLRSESNNFKESDLPVPSYPFTVDEIKTKYGPNIFRTRGNGIAAASSIISNSACANIL